MASSNWVIAASAVRKLLLAAAIPVAAIEAHLRWGFEYHGPGMHQVSLLFTIGMIATFCSVLFLLCGGLVAWLLRRRNWLAHWAGDAVLFSGWCGFAIWVAVTAEIVDG